MWAKELAHENGLAGPGENELKESRPGPHPLAGFDLTTLAAFDLTTEAKSAMACSSSPPGPPFIFQEVTGGLSQNLNPQRLEPPCYHDAYRGGQLSAEGPSVGGVRVPSLRDVATSLVR